MFASGPTLSPWLRLQVTSCLVLRWVDWEKADQVLWEAEVTVVCTDKVRKPEKHPFPQTSGPLLLPRTQIASYLGWRQWRQGACPSAPRSLNPVGAQIDVLPPPWQRILLTSSLPLLGRAQCWAAKKKLFSLSLIFCPPSLLFYEGSTEWLRSCVSLGTYLDFPPPCRHKNGSLMFLR